MPGRVSSSSCFQKHLFTCRRKILNELHGKHQSALAKATQMVTETKTKLEKHLENEKLILVPLRCKVESLVRSELGPLIESEQDIERRCEDVDKESRERKKMIYKQRRRIALLERQHNQVTQGRTVILKSLKYF